MWSNFLHHFQFRHQICEFYICCIFCWTKYPKEMLVITLSLINVVLIFHTYFIFHVPFKVFTATVSLIEPNLGIYASALRTFPNAPSPIVPCSRTFSRVISQSSSYGISLPYIKKKKTIHTKLTKSMTSAVQNSKLL